MEEVEIAISTPPPSPRIPRAPIFPSLPFRPKEKPIQIAICVTGNWKTTKIPLEYLILLLNSKGEASCPFHHILGSSEGIHLQGPK